MVDSKRKRGIRRLSLVWFVGVNVAFYLVILAERLDQLKGLWHRLVGWLAAGGLP